MIQLGTFGVPVTIDVDKLQGLEASILTSLATTPVSWDMVVNYMTDGYVQLEPMLSTVLLLAEWEKGFALMRNSQGIKIILRP